MNIIETNFKWNGSLSYGNRPGKIVLHHAEASVCTVQDIHKWHLNFGWTGIGYHFFVRKDGSIYRGRPENTIGAHVSGANSNTLGICAEGSYMAETMPESQKQAIKDLIKYLDSKYGRLPVYGHREVGSSNCPGTNYPLAELKSRDNSVQPTPNPAPNNDYTNTAKKYLGANTKKVQSLLNCLGWNLSVDGDCGPATATAIKDFQKKYGLDVDYKFGRQCYNKAYDLICGRLIVKGNKGNEVKLIQLVVGAGTDGIFGTETERKVKEYQTKNSLSADGKVGKHTWKYVIGV